MLLRIFLGIAGVFFGFVLVWKANWMVENLGRIPWAEAHLSTDGGSRMMYKLVGLLVIILSFMYMFGFFQSLVLAAFKPMMPKQL